MLATTYPRDERYVLFPASTVFPGSYGGNLFTPPMRRQQNQMAGSLMFPVYVSATVWRDGDTFYARELPYMGDIAGLEVITNSGPVLVDDDLAAELEAAILAADPADLLSQATLEVV